MALTAVFGADFESFERAIQHASVELQVFDRATRTATRSLRRELESLSGQRIAVEAARMAEAVRRLGGEMGIAGGLSKLTREELERFRRTMDEARAKAQALGEALPPSLQQAHQALAKFPVEGEGVVGMLKKISSGLSSLGGLVPVTSLAGVTTALVALGRSAMESAGHLVDLHHRTGISLGTLQELTMVAQQTGTSIETFTGGIFRLGVTLAEGSGRARAAIRDLGLSFEEIQQMRPEDQFKAVIAALEGLDTQQERNRLGVALFGKQFSEMAAAVQEGMTAMTEGTVKATDEQIQALDRLSDEWERTKQNILARAQSIAGALAQGILAARETDFRLLSQSQRDLLTEQAFSPGALARVQGRMRETDIPLPVSDQSVQRARDFVAELDEMREKIARLTPAMRAQIDAALQLEGVDESLAAQFGLTIEELRLYQSTVKSTSQALESAQSVQARFDEEVRRSREQIVQAAKDLVRFAEAASLKALTRPEDQVRLAERLTQPVVEAIQLNLRLQTQYQTELTRLSQEQTLTRVDFEIAEIQRWAQAEKARVGIAHETLRLIDEIAQRRIQKVIDDDVLAQMILFANLATDAAHRVKELNRQALAAQREGLRRLAESFRTLAEVTGGAEGLAGRIAEVLSAMSLGAEAGAQFGEGLETLKKGGVSTTIAGLQQMSAAALSAAAALAQATDVAGRAHRVMSGVLVGAQAGAQIGGAIAGPLGQAVGAAAGGLIGGLVGLFRRPAWEDVMRRVGHTWGVRISEGLARGIAETARQRFGGNRQAAEIFSLNEILAEAGGLTDENLGVFTQRLRDVFSMLETGLFSASDAAHVLNTTWRQFVEAGTDRAGRLTRELREIVVLARASGEEFREITAFMREQMGTALGGFRDIVAGVTAPWIALGDRIREVFGDGASLSQRLEEHGDLLARQAIEAARARDALADLGTIALGTYSAAIQAGYSHVEAIQAAAPGLQMLGRAYDSLGLSIDNAAVRALVMQGTLLEQNPELLRGISALAESFIALDNIGLLTTETFAAMQRTGVEMYTRLQDEVAKTGGTTRDALLPMQGFLQEAARQAELLGIPLDENLRILIEQSRELGIWREQGESAQQRMLRATERLADVMEQLAYTLGVELPQGASAAAGAIVDMAERSRRALQTIGPPEIVGPLAPESPFGPGAIVGASAFSQIAGAAASPITVHLQVDGREMANVTIDHLERALAVRGGR